MAQKVEIIAPHLRANQTALTIRRWLKGLGDTMVINEPIAELIGDEMVVYVHAPDDGVLSSILVYDGQNVLSGTVLATMSVVSKNDIDWDNFDQVTSLIEDFAEKAKNFKQSKDANEALAQLLGIGDDLAFQGLNIEQQNKFLQNMVDQHQQNGLTPADVTQKLLEGLYLRMPANAPMRPSGPALGMAMGLGGGMRPNAPAPSGPGGSGPGVGYVGITQQQQQGYAPPPRNDDNNN